MDNREAGHSAWGAPGLFRGVLAESEGREGAPHPSGRGAAGGTPRGGPPAPPAGIMPTSGMKSFSGPRADKLQHVHVWGSETWFGSVYFYWRGEGGVAHRAL